MILKCGYKGKVLWKEDVFQLQDATFGTDVVIGQR